MDILVKNFLNIFEYNENHSKDKTYYVNMIKKINFDKLNYSEIEKILNRVDETMNILEDKHSETGSIISFSVWKELSKKNIPIEFLLHFPFNDVTLIESGYLSEEVVLSHPSLFDKESVSTHINYNEAIFQKYKDFLDFDILAQRFKLSEDFIRMNFSRFYKHNLCIFQDLSEDFMEYYSRYLLFHHGNVVALFTNQRMSDDFFLKFLENENINNTKYKLAIIASLDNKYISETIKTRIKEELDFMRLFVP